MKYLFSLKQKSGVRSMLYTFILFCSYTPIISCMEQPYQHSISEPPLTEDQIKLAQRQHQLQVAYYKPEGSITLDSALWKRIKEKRRSGTVIVLRPDGYSDYQGHFMRTIKEIHYDTKNKIFFERHIYEPTEPVAFVIGSAIVGSALYWYFTKTSNGSEQ